MRRFFNPVLKTGLFLSVGGSLPLLLAVLIGKWSGDPNPNPVGPGIQFFFTFWPGMVLLGVGLVMGLVQVLSGTNRNS